MTFDAGLGQLRSRSFRLVRRMAGGAGWQFVGGMIGERMLRVELLGVAGLADRILRLHQEVGVVAAMPIVAKQTFTHGQAGMRLAHHLPVILMAFVTRCRLGLGQQGCIRPLVESAMTIRALAFGKWLVRMTEAVRLRQIGMALFAGFPVQRHL